jgi:hypothetical protein
MVSFLAATAFSRGLLASYIATPFAHIAMRAGHRLKEKRYAEKIYFCGNRIRKLAVFAGSSFVRAVVE